MSYEEETSQFGDYVIRKLLRENTTTRSWLAEQKSVGRMVLIEELRQDAFDQREEFLADVRAKASVDHPLVGSIYEACSEDGHCFFAHELLPGESVREMTASGKRMRALRFVHLLHRVAEANIYHETHGNATSPLDADCVVIDEQGVVRIQNLAISGKRLPEQSTRDVMKIGLSFEPLVDLDHPGATRCLTLLAWMRGEQVDSPLTWESVRNFCEQIEFQLTEPATSHGPVTAAVKQEKKSGFVIVIAVLLLAVVAGIFFLTKKDRPPSVNVEKPGWVTISEGTHTTPEGQVMQINGFEMSAHEVTIGEYAEFLEDLTFVSNSKSFDHPDQPAEKTDHLPDDWDNLHASAMKGEVWNKKTVNIHTPVVGIDWWDAFAYTKWKKIDAKWKECFLPTQEQWHYALVSGSDDPSKIGVSDLIPVTEKNNPDKTKNGLLAMAGSVAEWTAEPRPSPDNPLGNAKWVIIGGSYLKPGNGASSREWVDDRSLRRPDLGFRICRMPK